MTVAEAGSAVGVVSSVLAMLTVAWHGSKGAGVSASRQESNEANVAAMQETVKELLAFKIAQVERNVGQDRVNLRVDEARRDLDRAKGREDARNSRDGRDGRREE